MLDRNVSRPGNLNELLLAPYISGFVLFRFNSKMLDYSFGSVT